MKLLWILFVIKTIHLSWGQDSNSVNSSSVCNDGKNVNQLFQCLLENHPQLGAFQAELKSSQYGIDLGKQRPNPSVSAQSIAGKQFGQNVSETTVQYVHTFELGGKRAARIERASAEKEFVQAEIFGTATNLTFEVAQKIYRIKQNAREFAIVEETVLTFKKILQSYLSRAALSAEQKVSKNVFELALKDYGNKKNNLLIEQADLQTYFNSLSLASFNKVVELSNTLNYEAKNIEQRFDSQLSGKKENGPELQLADAQLKIALADLSVQKSLTWGNLEIGPTYQYRYEEGNGYPLVGIGLSLPLPLYHQNTGGKQQSLFAAKSTEYLRNYEEKKIQSEWSSLARAFKQTIENIKTQPSNNDMERKHHGLEGLFYRGLVPSSLIVEAHRQMVDLTESQHQQQLKSIALLCRAYALNGEIPKDFL